MRTGLSKHRASRQGFRFHGFFLLLYTAPYSPYTSTIPKTHYFQNMHAFWKYAFDHNFSLSGTSFLIHWSVKLTLPRLNLPIISFRNTELITPSPVFLQHLIIFSITACITLQGYVYIAGSVTTLWVLFINCVCDYIKNLASLWALGGTGLCSNYSFIHRFQNLFLLCNGYWEYKLNKVVNNKH